VTISAFSVMIAWERALTAVSRAILISRIISLVPSALLGGSGGGACQHRASGVLGVDRVALAALAPVAPVRAPGLDDALVVAAQAGDQALTVGAAAPHPEAPGRPQRAGPGQQLLISTEVGGDVGELGYFRA
jgi:hypothetical protein